MPGTVQHGENVLQRINADNIATGTSTAFSPEIRFLHREVAYLPQDHEITRGNTLKQGSLSTICAALRKAYAPFADVFREDKNA